MLIIGHRGAMGYAPENTITSFKKAIAQECDGIEIDVQLTKDNYLVVCHDWDVSRTTNGEGEIKDLTFSHIRELSIRQCSESRTLSEKIPTLSEVLDLIPDSMLLNIEIKSKASDERDIGEKVIELLEKHGKIDNIVISSFNHTVLKRIRKINKDIKIALLLSGFLINPVEYLRSNELDVYSYHPPLDYTSKDMITLLQKEGIKVFPWIVNQKNDLKKCVDYGADGFTTNYPDRLREYLKELKS